MAGRFSVPWFDSRLDLKKGHGAFVYWLGPQFFKLEKRDRNPHALLGTVLASESTILNTPHTMRKILEHNRRLNATEKAIANVVFAKTGDSVFHDDGESTTLDLGRVEVSYHQNGDFTVAMVADVEYARLGLIKGVTISFGVTKRNPKDTPNPEAAKLIAFERAVQRDE